MFQDHQVQLIEQAVMYSALFGGVLVFLLTAILVTIIGGKR